MLDIGMTEGRVVYKSLLDPSLLPANIPVGGTTLVTMVGRGRGRGKGRGTGQTLVTKSHRHTENNTVTNDLHETNENYNNANTHAEEVVISEAQFQDAVASEWITKMEVVIKLSECRSDQAVKFAANCLETIALDWWESVKQARGEQTVENMKWNEFKELVLQRFCPQNELDKLEEEFQRLEAGTITHQDATVYDDVAAQEAKEKAEKTAEIKPVETKRKSEEIMYRFKPRNFKFPKREGNNPLRNPQEMRCYKCQKTGHTATYCPSLRCFNCNEMGHILRNCTKSVQQKTKEGEKGRLFVIGDGGRNNNAKVVAGMFLVNDIYAKILFDTGSNRRFFSDAFSLHLGMKPTPLERGYVVETTSGEQIRITESCANCNMTLGNENSLIKLMPMSMSKYDIIIGMDWLNQCHAQIDCDQRTIRIYRPNGESMLIQCYSDKNKIETIYVAKAKKCVNTGCSVFIVYTLDSKPERQVMDISIVCDHPDVFPEELSSLPPDRQIEFRIDLIPGAKPVARALYRLAPSELKELMK
ncbi:hypothetical protein L1987_06467 [Smallanthus sonchifolius]|uniref:Uncharacterized protein n=1 Tax=Smallanthus sonchifolius TaxID=185202 RepID=A0ACB9JYA7_9ASTR|nr:hypothetical protein L1987_06467 [Smallanthus sonchifolius]